MIPRLVPVLSIVAAMLVYTPSLAETLCGLVTDEVSGAPVASAGILVHQNDAYTGLHAATDAAGGFCIDGILPGTYRLEIRVDDYLTGWREGVVVDVGTGVVEIPVAIPAVFLAAPWPNPASSHVKVNLEVRRDASVELSVFDGRGRLIRQWAAEHLTPGSLIHEWDGDGSDGRPAPDGLYFLRARADNDVATRRVVLIR